MPVQKSWSDERLASRLCSIKAPSPLPVMRNDPAKQRDRAHRLEPHGPTCYLHDSHLTTSRMSFTSHSVITVLLFEATLFVFFKASGISNIPRDVFDQPLTSHLAMSSLNTKIFLCGLLLEEQDKYLTLFYMRCWKEVIQLHRVI